MGLCYTDHRAARRDGRADLHIVVFTHTHTLTQTSTTGQNRSSFIIHLAGHEGVGSAQHASRLLFFRVLHDHSVALALSMLMISTCCLGPRENREAIIIG
jgi:hypothetical protein